MINSWIVLRKSYNLPLIYLKRRFPIFLTWKCHQMEYQFIFTTLILCFVWIMQVSRARFRVTLLHGLVNSIFHKTLQAQEDKSEPNVIKNQKKPGVVYFHFPYYWDTGFQLIKSYIPISCASDLIWFSCKIGIFCITKIEVLLSTIFFDVYEFTCLSCSAKFTGKTKRTRMEW